jgi:2,3-bisphosphoglycerate-independent phosphoglycerate mutase
MDGFEKFSEMNARCGSLGIFPSVYLMPLILAHAGKLQKFGA